MSDVETKLVNDSLAFNYNSKRKHLHKLAAKILSLCEQDGDVGEGMGWGICDSKRPFGFSGYYAVYGDVLEFAGIEHAGEEEYTDEQLEYGRELYEDVADYIRERWQEISEP